ncbi:MAG TPA: DMT family transporter [Clostridia bacterium]|nr:DMT family transporter [Clostridia bacterium]
MENASDKKSMLLLNLAVMLFGLSGTVARLLSASPVAITFGRAACSACLLFLLLVLKKERLRPARGKDAPLLLIAGAVLAAHWVCFFRAVQLASVAAGTVTFSTFPLFLIFLEPLVFKEKFKPQNLPFAAALLLGAAVIAPSASLGDKATAGVLWGMASSLTYAALTLFNRFFAARYSAVKICFYEQGAAALVLIPALLLEKPAVAVWDIAGIAVIGVFCTALGFSLFVTAQKRVRAQTAGILSGMETVYGVLFAFLLLREAPMPREIMGGCVILGATTLFATRTSHKLR